MGTTMMCWLALQCTIIVVSSWQQHHSAQHETYQNCWRRGRTVLAGDAAHPIPPNLAQGAGQSLVDAACLMRWLGRTGIDDALSIYAQERSKAVSIIFKKSDDTGKDNGN